MKKKKKIQYITKSTFGEYLKFLRIFFWFYIFFVPTREVSLFTWFIDANFILKHQISIGAFFHSSTSLKNIDFDLQRRCEVNKITVGENSDIYVKILKGIDGFFYPCKNV